MNDYCYNISKASLRPELRGLWDGPAWSEVQFLRIDQFRSEGTSHRPFVLCKLLYDESYLYGLFLVRDRYIRCIHTRFQDPVYEDSCVEFFVEPRTDGGYFNFEFNCGGTLLVSYVTNPTRADGRVTGATPLSMDEGRQVKVFGSLPPLVKNEIEDEVSWSIEFAIPFALLEGYMGSLGKIEGQEWRGNLYKCGNKTSHPHWASWSPLSERNFHAPWDFGVLRFMP